MKLYLQKQYQKYSLIKVIYLTDALKVNELCPEEEIKCQWFFRLKLPVSMQMNSVTNTAILKTITTIKIYTCKSVPCSTVCYLNVSLNSLIPNGTVLTNKLITVLLKLTGA